MPTKKPTTTPRRSASSAGQAKNAPKTAAKPAATKVAKKPAGTVTAPASDLTKKYRSHKGDNGSTDIQVIGLTEKIATLTSHLSTHAKDHDSRRGLLIMVGKRRRLLNYLKRQDETTYGKLVADLGLRR